MREPLPKALHQPVDEDARRLARRLARASSFATMAVLEPVTGQPLASRVALASDIDGAPIILISALSAHTGALQADPRCSLLTGEPGRGDPLAHPRMTLIGQARQIQRDSVEGMRAKRRYLARQPKAGLYADFGDFAFWRIELERASLNGGFGKAFELASSDLLDTIDIDAFDAIEADVIAHMNNQHLDALKRCAERLLRDAQADWKMTGFDRFGLDLRDGDRLLRLEFSKPIDEPGAVRAAMIALVQRQA